MPRTTATKVAKLLLDIKAVTFRINPPYTFTSGLKSPIYLDNRLVMSHPTVRTKIINYYIKVIKQRVGLKNFSWISGTATAAIPHAAFVATKLKLPMVYVRPTTKSYGKGNQIEGYLRKGAKVLIIEDHISTAASVIGNAKAIKSFGSKVDYCITTTTFESKKSQTNLKRNRINLIHLTTGKVIVETASKQGLITQKQKRSIDLWFENPSNWTKTIGLE